MHGQPTKHPHTSQHPELPRPRVGHGTKAGTALWRSRLISLLNKGIKSAHFLPSSTVPMERGNTTRQPFSGTRHRDKAPRAGQHHCKWDRKILCSVPRSQQNWSIHLSSKSQVRYMTAAEALLDEKGFWGWVYPANRLCILTDVHAAHKAFNMCSQAPCWEQKSLTGDQNVVHVHVREPHAYVSSP